MSTASELAQREAMVAEAELTDAEAERVTELVTEGAELADAIATVLASREQPDEEEQPETPPAPAPPAFVVDDKKVEKEIERHLTRMADLLGPTAEQYEPCEECGAAGIRIPGPKMLTNERYRACPTCEGWGKVLTGSKDPQYVATNCPTCMGRGFQERVSEPQGGGEQVQQVEPTGDGFGTPAWMGDPNVKPRNPAGGWQ